MTKRASGAYPAIVAAIRQGRSPSFRQLRRLRRRFQREALVGGGDERVCSKRLRALIKGALAGG